MYGYEATELTMRLLIFLILKSALPALSVEYLYATSGSTSGSY
jgi:hypothetical protein